MTNILKKDIFNENSTEVTGKEKVDKIMDTIAEKPKDQKLSIMPQQNIETESMQGLLSDEVLMEGENKLEMELLQDKLIKELKPANKIESIIVDRIISSMWRLKRYLKIESQIMDYMTSGIEEYEHGFFSTRKRTDKEISQLKAFKLAEGKGRLEEFCKYEIILERQIYRALNELNKLRRRELKRQKVTSIKKK
jgi:uncharacterized protein YheU (UPF0270 family)